MNCVDRAIYVAIKERDKHTAQHCLRVGFLAEALGRAIHLSKDDLVSLREAGFVHDAGKIGIPDSILMKDGQLDAHEFEIIKTHSLCGERIITAQSIVPLSGSSQRQSIIEAVRHHHEHYDGSGYPDGIKGDEIPLFARIILIADCYTAMTEIRRYHQVKSHEETMTIMNAESGTYSDPELFEVFSEMIDNCPLRYRQTATLEEPLRPC